MTSAKSTNSSLPHEMIVPSRRPLVPLDRVALWASLVFAAILGSRLIIVGGIYVITNGHEYTLDATVWKHLAEDPFQNFLGWGNFVAAYPPLQPLLEAAIYLPFQHLFGDFIALRVTSSIYEAIGAGLLTILLARLRSNAFIGMLVLTTLLFNPIGWVASALWGQDEPMFFPTATAILLLLHANRPIAAILLAAIGVVAVKIFFLVVLLPMIVFWPWGSIAVRALIAVTPIVAVYLVTFIGSFAYLGHVNFALLSFEPGNTFSISLWGAMSTVFHWPASSVQRPVAGLLSLLAALLLCAVIRHRRPTLRFDQLALLTAVLLMWVLFLFYLVNPEYYIFLFPYCFLLVQTIFDFCFFMVLGFFCWGVNYAFAIKNNLNSLNPVHQKVVAYYLTYAPIDINLLHPLVLTVFAILSATFAAKMTVKLLRNVQYPAYQ
jgi:hypothetical protein